MRNVSQAYLESKNNEVKVLHNSYPETFSHCHTLACIPYPSNNLLFEKTWLDEKSGTLAFPAGTCHTLGVGGHFSREGYGTLFRKHGLAADNIIDAHLIDANGKVLDRKSVGEDLFWVIRGGGGGSYGFALPWKLKLVPVLAIVTVFTVTKTWEQNATELIHRLQYVFFV
ncbi:hypothetical protein CRYUN_Cryun12cG0097000 [Craigia yunnanensis]